MPKKSKANLQLEEIQRRFQMLSKDLERLRVDAQRLLEDRTVELAGEGSPTAYVDFIWEDELKVSIATVEGKPSNPRLAGCLLTDIVRIVE